MSLRLDALFVHPVKSCRGLAVSGWEVDRFGLRYDRAFMVVDARSGVFLTQREEPRLALVAPRIEGGMLVLAAEDAESVALPLDLADGPRRRVRVWRHEGEAIDAGEHAAAWLGERLGRKLRLVRMAPDHARRANPERVPLEAPTSFVDAYPFLLIGRASLDDLGARVGTPLPVERFRPNLVIAGAEPYAEDGWRRIRIGPLELLVVKPCDRCTVTTVDPWLGVRQGGEPLRTLARYRRAGGAVFFGQNAVHVGPGRLEVGMPVEVLETQEPLAFECSKALVSIRSPADVQPVISDYDHRVDHGNGNRWSPNPRGTEAAWGWTSRILMSGIRAWRTIERRLEQTFRHEGDLRCTGYRACSSSASSSVCR